MAAESLQPRGSGRLPDEIPSFEPARASIVDALACRGATTLVALRTASIRQFDELMGFMPELRLGGGERGLLIAGPDDLVCIPDTPEPAYIEALHAFGLGCRSENILVLPDYFRPTPRRGLQAAVHDFCDAVAGRLSRVGPEPRLALLPLSGSRLEFAVADELRRRTSAPVQVLASSPASMAFADAKHRVRGLAITLGVPVATGEVVHLHDRRSGDRGGMDALRRSIERLLPRSGRVIVRGSSGIAGSTVHVIGDRRDGFEPVLDRIAAGANRTYLVEVFEEVAASPNVQMNIDPETRRISFVGATDQRLANGIEHRGNSFPSHASTLDDMIQFAGRICLRFRDRGVAGLIGFDFCEVRDPATGSARPFLAEVNPRLNGATLPVLVMERLNERQAACGHPAIAGFACDKVPTAARSFTELAETCGHLFFEPSTATGIIPFNVSRMKLAGYFHAVVFAPSREAAEGILSELIDRSATDGARSSRGARSCAAGEHARPPFLSEHAMTAHVSEKTESPGHAR